MNAEYLIMSDDESNNNIPSNDDDVILNEEMSLIVNIDENKVVDGEEYQSIDSVNIILMKKYIHMYIYILIYI